MKDSSKDRNNYSLLKKRLNTYGYLLIRNFFNPKATDKICIEVNKVYEKYRKIDSNSDPRTSNNYADAYSLECLHQIWHQKNVKSFFDNIFGEESFLHPRVVLRNGYKNDFTPAHQDWPQVQGSKNTLGIWVALKNIKKGGGLLEIADKSHKNGIWEHNPHKKYGGMIIKNKKLKWLSTNMNSGDAIIFTCLTVHRTENNKSDVVRQSIDSRWQPLSESICNESLKPLINISWKNIYKNWKDKQYAWYWNNIKIKKESFDPYYEITSANNIINNYKKDKSWKPAVQKVIDRTSSPILKILCRDLLNKNG